MKYKGYRMQKCRYKCIDGTACLDEMDWINIIVYNVIYKRVLDGA